MEAGTCPLLVPRQIRETSARRLEKRRAGSRFRRRASICEASEHPPREATLKVTSLIYDIDTAKTVGILEEAHEPPYLPKDPVSVMLTSEAQQLGHRLKLVPFDCDYKRTVKFFRNTDGDDPDVICWEPPAKEVEESSLKDTARIYRTQAIPEHIKDRVILLREKGKSLRRISREIGIALSTVQKILKTVTLGQ